MKERLEVNFSLWVYVAIPIIKTVSRWCNQWSNIDKRFMCWQQRLVQRAKAIYRLMSRSDSSLATKKKHSSFDYCYLFFFLLNILNFNVFRSFFFSIILKLKSRIESKNSSILGNTLNRDQELFLNIGKVWSLFITFKLFWLLNIKIINFEIHI